MQKPPPFPCPKTFWFSQSLKTSILFFSFFLVSFCFFFKSLALLLMIPYTILLHFAKFLKFKHKFFFLEKKDCICGYMDRHVLLRHEIWNCKLRKVRDLRFAIRYLPLTTCCRALFVNEDLQVDKPRTTKNFLFLFLQKERKKERKIQKAFKPTCSSLIKVSSPKCTFFLFFTFFFFFCFVLF